MKTNVGLIARHVGPKSVDECRMSPELANQGRAELTCFFHPRSARLDDRRSKTRHSLPGFWNGTKANKNRSLAVGGNMIHVASIVFFSIISLLAFGLAAFAAGIKTENWLNRQPVRAEDFILKFLADGKEHSASEVYNNASAVGIPYLSVYVAHGNLSEPEVKSYGNGKVKAIWRDNQQWLRLAQC